MTSSFYVLLVLLEDIILHCLSLSVVLMRRSIVLLIGLSISGRACRVILLMQIAFLYLSKNYFLLTFTPFLQVEFT